MKDPEDEEFERIEKESGWRKRQIKEREPRWREWYGLTVEEIEAKADESRPVTDFSSFYAGARWAEFKLKERNCG